MRFGKDTNRGQKKINISDLMKRNKKYIFSIALLLICLVSVIKSVNSTKTLIDNLNIKPVTKDSVIYKSVTILSFEKVVNSQSAFYNMYASGCEGWFLNEEQIKEIIHESKPIDGFTFSYFFDVLPCEYVGKLITNDSCKMDFTINAGSYILVSNNDTSMYLGYYGNEKYFIISQAKNSDFKK